MSIYNESNFLARRGASAQLPPGQNRLTRGVLHQVRHVVFLQYLSCTFAYNDFNANPCGVSKYRSNARVPVYYSRPTVWKASALVRKAHFCIMGTQREVVQTTVMWVEGSFTQTKKHFPVLSYHGELLFLNTSLRPGHRAKKRRSCIVPTDLWRLLLWNLSLNTIRTNYLWNGGTFDVLFAMPTAKTTACQKSIASGSPPITLKHFLRNAFGKLSIYKPINAVASTQDSQIWYHWKESLTSCIGSLPRKGSSAALTNRLGVRIFGIYVALLPSL